MRKAASIAHTVLAMLLLAAVAAALLRSAERPAELLLTDEQSLELVETGVQLKARVAQGKQSLRLWSAGVAMMPGTSAEKVRHLQDSVLPNFEGCVGLVKVLEPLEGPVRPLVRAVQVAVRDVLDALEALKVAQSDGSRARVREREDAAAQKIQAAEAAVEALLGSATEKR